METPATAGSVSCSSCIFVRAKLNYFSMIFHPSVKRILTKACKPPFDKFMYAQLHTFFLTSCMTGVSSPRGHLLPHHPNANSQQQLADQFCIASWFPTKVGRE